MTILQNFKEMTWNFGFHLELSTAADPGFPVGGGVDLVGGLGLPRWLHFENFVCQNERIWGGVRRASANVDPPMIKVIARDCYNVLLSVV